MGGGKPNGGAEKIYTSSATAPRSASANLCAVGGRAARGADSTDAAKATTADCSPEPGSRSPGPTRRRRIRCVTSFVPAKGCSPETIS